MAKDAVKRIFGKSANEIIAEAKESAKKQEKLDREKAKRLSTEFFETHSGPEELKHFYWLLEQLDDKQLNTLATKCGVSSNYSDLDRDTLTSWLEETDRETFYREYHKVLKPKKP